jgi:hypothetical protein
VKAYNGINDFKWHDWAGSLELTYDPIRIPSLFHPTEFILKLCKEKISSIVPDNIYKVGLKGYGLYQSVSIIPHAKKILAQIRNTAPNLSSDTVMSARVDQLLNLLEDVKKKYA